MSDFLSNKTSAPKVGISACLTGQEVRYNGGHCNSKLCTQTLDQYFDFTPFCPEVVAGFGIPRPTLRLAGSPEAPRLITSDNPDTDLTGQFTEQVTPHLPRFSELDGYILMKNSPSCGMERIKVYQENGSLHPTRGRGLFADMLMKQYPLLPVEEEGRLHDDQLRENFILRVYALHNFRHEVLAAPSFHQLLQFHSSYKYTVMAHSQTAYREIGRMLAGAHSQELEASVTQYHHLFMSALAKPAPRKGHVNVLLHLLGYLKKTVDSVSRQKIVQTVEQYRQGNIPLITPMTLLKHYIDMKGNEYIQAQRYLEPYPEELGLRNKL